MSKGKEIPSEKTVFVHHGRYFIEAKHSKERITSYLHVFWSSLMRSKDRRKRIRHSQFCERVPQQISSPFILPLVGCQLVNSVCFAAHTAIYICIHAHARVRFFRRRVFQSGIRSSLFPEGIFGSTSGK